MQWVCTRPRGLSRNCSWRVVEGGWVEGSLGGLGRTSERARSAVLLLDAALQCHSLQHCREREGGRTGKKGRRMGVIEGGTTEEREREGVIERERERHRERHRERLIHLRGI